MEKKLVNKIKKSLRNSAFLYFIAHLKIVKRKK